MISNVRSSRTFRGCARPVRDLGKSRSKQEEAGRLTAYSIKTRPMATKLYVGGLPYATTQDELRDAFAKAGNVTSASIIMDRMTNRSRGFGFVEMATDEDAQKAIEMWNGQDFDGRKLIVNEAKPLEPRAPRGDSRY